MKATHDQSNTSIASNDVIQTKTFNVRWYKSGDEKQIVELLDLVFDGWPKIDLQGSKLDYWRWKHQESIDKTDCVTLGVTPDGKIVGCLHAPLFKVKLGDTVQLFYQGVDLVVHPEYRRMGMYRKMDELYTDEYIAYNYTTNPIVMKKPIENNRPRLPFIRKYVHFKDYASTKGGKSSIIKRIGYKVVKTFNKTLYRNRSQKEDISIREMNEFPIEVNEIGAITIEKTRFSLVKDQDYLNWRYCDTRGPKYRIRFAYKGEKLVGYCVSKNNLSDPSNPKGYVVDVGVLPEETRAVEHLVSDAVETLHELGTNEVYMFIIRGHQYEKVVKSLGFVDSRSELFIWFGSLLDDREALVRKALDTDPDKLDFQAGDLDII